MFVFIGMAILILTNQDLYKWLDQLRNFYCLPTTSVMIITIMCLQIYYRGERIRSYGSNRQNIFWYKKRCLCCMCTCTHNIFIYSIQSHRRNEVYGAEMMTYINNGVMNLRWDFTSTSTRWSFQKILLWYESKYLNQYKFNIILTLAN